jgi:hypothetical protein
MRNRPKSHLLHCCALPAWWPSAKRSDPIPSRTRPSNASAPMVLCLKTWESRSSPGLQCTIIPLLRSHPKFEFYRWGLRRISLRGLTEHKCVTDAGWSSPVARQAHNLKVVSSNLAPATKSNLSKRQLRILSSSRSFRRAIRTARTLNRRPSLARDFSASSAANAFFALDDYAESRRGVSPS